MRRIYKTVYEAFEDFVEWFNWGFLIFFSTCVSFMSFEFIFVFFLLISYWISDQRLRKGTLQWTGKQIFLCEGDFDIAAFYRNFKLRTLLIFRNDLHSFTHIMVLVGTVDHVLSSQQFTTHHQTSVASVTHDWTDINKTLIMPLVWMDRIYWKSDRRGCQRL